jgi:hypothetical protein
MAWLTPPAPLIKIKKREVCIELAFFDREIPFGLD